VSSGDRDLDGVIVGGDGGNLLLLLLLLLLDLGLALAVGGADLEGVFSGFCLPGVDVLALGVRGELGGEPGIVPGLGRRRRPRRGTWWPRWRSAGSMGRES
jgi:hypothetical protein